MSIHIVRDVRIEVVPDERGESEDYEAYSMVDLDAFGRVLWVEGIRKDRTGMYPDVRAIVEARLTELKGDK